MKTLSCDLCDHAESAETFEAWMEALKPHYMQAHADVMNSHAGNPEEMQAKMMAWMDENKKRFEAAGEDMPAAG